MKIHTHTTVDGRPALVYEPENDEDAAALEASGDVDRAVLFADHREEEER
ncbi:MAG TPA: hypothetical protein VN461_08035 [Vicinamibacteria bacterium]|jgi:hypothetical protein|nr:hypothetical protein [Vicinamibacteria bacterium]